MAKNSINYVCLTKYKHRQRIFLGCFFLLYIFFSLKLYFFIYILPSLAIPTLQINRTIQTPLPSLTPIKTSPINSLSKTLTGGQTAQMLRLLEPQLTSSYRQAFVPYYQRPVVPVVGLLPPASVSQRKLSIVSTTSASSRRMSSVLGLRRRESNVSQLGLVPPQDLQNRLSLPPVFKQQQQPRPSISMNRLSDGDALTKLRSKNLITIEN